jgi:hypothetical protein
LEVGKEIRIDVLVVFSLFLRLGFARTQTLRNSGTLFHPNLPAASKRSSEAGMVRAYTTICPSVPSSRTLGRERLEHRHMTHILEFLSLPMGESLGGKDVGTLVDRTVVKYTPSSNLCSFSKQEQRLMVMESES